MRTRATNVLLCCGLLAVALTLVIGIAGRTTAVADGSSPGVRVLNSLMNQYGPVRFDHEKHVSIAGSCAACHHEHKEGSAFSCKSCHSLTPSAFKGSAHQSFTACRNCHGEADPNTPGIPGLKTAYHKQCFQCHRGMAGIGSDPKGCAELCHAKRSVKLSMRTAP